MHPPIHRQEYRERTRICVSQPADISWTGAWKKTDQIKSEDMEYVSTLARVVRSILILATLHTHSSYTYHTYM
jgi:hypothetical protein